MSQGQETQKLPGEGDQTKSKKKTGEDKATPARKKIEDPRIKVVEKDDVEIFKCDECGADFKSMAGAKQHMAKKHRERSEDDPDDEEAKKARTERESETSFNEDILDEWDDKDDEEITPSQAASIEEIMSKYDEVKIVSVVEGNKKGAEDQEVDKVEAEKSSKAELESALERIQEVEEEMHETKAKLESLENLMENKDNLIDLYKSKSDQLEYESINKDVEIKRGKRVIKNMEAEIKKLRDESGGGTGTEKENKAKIKKLNDEIKAKEKKVVDTEKKLLDAIKQVGEESNKRVEADIKMKTLEKTLDNLTKLVEMSGMNTAAGSVGPRQHASREVEVSRRKEQGSTGRNDREQESRRSEQWSKVECRDQKKPGGCTWGSACRYLHPEGVGRVEQIKLIDCNHWMEGYCMFDDDRCKNIHDASKKGTKKKASKQDFSEALAMVREVRDAMAGGGIIKQGGGQPMMTPSSQQQMMMNPQLPLQMMMPQSMTPQMNQMAQMNPVSQMMMTPMMMMQPSMQMQHQGLGGGQQGHLPNARQ